MPCKKKAGLFVGLFFVIFSGMYGQNQAVADSLERVYTSGNFKENERLQLLNDLASSESGKVVAIQ